MTTSLSRLALALAVAAPAWAQKAGSFASGGDSQISAMMVSDTGVVRVKRAQ